MKAWFYVMCVFLGGCSFGVLSTIVKLAYAAGFNMFEVTGSQFLMGTIIIWILALFANKKRLNSKQIITLILGGFPMGLTGIFYYYSLESLDASLAIIFLFQFVWIGALSEWVILKRKPSSIKTASIFIVLIGSILAAGIFATGEKPIDTSGAVWGILAALSFSFFLLISSLVEKEVPAIQRSAILSTGAMVIVLIIVNPISWMNVSTLMNIAPYGILLGLFGVVIPPILFAIGMPHIGPGKGSILTASELPVAVLLSMMVLSEQVEWLQWLGVFIILFGIILGNVLFSKNNSISEVP
ncbi:EamA family transporter [Sutcliffiella horikoshii]|uniref:EamA family transporter n=1 Tax=Sutcliffiella horikoshii TaxID=79883 RepID=A0A5D4TBS8_9BACI|nr:DMT family transporter [Sutcliffiella horikoshii]TYS71616.1 EamA family transporter [Sutcliffiella horikoshii]